MEDGGFGNFNVIAQLAIEVQADVTLLRGRAYEALQQKRIRWILGISDNLGNEIIDPWSSHLQTSSPRFGIIERGYELVH
jgi:hypothetical protein